ncbi:MULTISPECIES: hypothetical protein [unclassified Microcoleus]|uniref:hypothetical protein n=1 Tax=unclassified Microcoleus TaxID=2642155 RepID=UPI002FD2389D
MYQVASNEVIAGRLQEFLSPLVYNQLGYDQLGLRSPILGLPLMMAAVLTLHNLAVELFLQSLMDYAAKPEAYQSSLGEVLPTYPEFTGCVFKLQANMDPKRRRIAFVRVCSGKFEKEMLVKHARTGKSIRDNAFEGQILVYLRIECVFIPEPLNFPSSRSRCGNFINHKIDRKSRLNLNLYKKWLILKTC